MANSKNTKKDRDEKKSGDLSELNEGYSSYDTDKNSETEGSEFISKYSSQPEDENDYSKSVYASKINKSFGDSSKTKNTSSEQKEEEDEDDDTYTSQLGNDQRKGYDQRNSRKTEQYQPGNRYSGSTHQLSYDQQGHYQQPVRNEQQYRQDYNNHQFRNRRSESPYYQNQQGFSNRNQGYEYGQTEQSQYSRYDQRNPYASYQSQDQPYPTGAYNQQNYNQHYNQLSFQQPRQEYNQSYNQAYNYGNQFGNQQFVNRGYENHNYNDQDNGLRSSYNTQGFGNSIYRHENDHPEFGGSGYSGSTFGGQGSGEFRSNAYNQQYPYGDPGFSSRREFRNPSRGYTRNYRQDEQQRNNYQHDEDGLTHSHDNYGHSENSYNSPYGNEREEQYGHERDNGHSTRSHNQSRNFENQNRREDERNYKQQYGHSNKRGRNRNRQNF